jgi:signal transduction histidine kinase
MDAKETSLYTAILIVSIVVAVMIIFFIASIIRQQRKNVELYRQNVLAEITAMEKERARIAADLHDELGPMLSAIKLRIGSFELTDEDDKKEAEKTNQHIDTLMKRMREISYDLIPNTLIRKGLVIALKQFSDFVNEGDGLKISFEAGDNINPDQQKSIHIYRIAQEVINNTIRHSGAKHLSISLKQDNSTLFLSTEDNGKGYDHQAAAKGEGGIGLRNILNRTEIIGGQMFVDSEKNKGTKYSFEIPL